MRDVADDVCAILEAAATTPELVRSTNLFVGLVPEDDDSDVPDICVAVLQTGGDESLPFMEATRKMLRRPSVQVRIRGAREEPEASQDLAGAIHDALELASMSPYVSIRVRESTPFPLPADGSGRPRWSINVELQYVEELGTPVTVP